MSEAITSFEAAPFFANKQRHDRELDQFEAAVEHDKCCGFFRTIEGENQDAFQDKMQEGDDSVAV